MSLPVPTTRTAATAATLPATTTLDPKEIQAMDAPLIALTNQCGGDLRRLMFAYFSFLNRRTDFYLVPHPDDISQGKPIKMGFKEGDAEKLLLAAFRQFPLRRIPPTSSKMPSGSSSSRGSRGVGGGDNTNNDNKNNKDNNSSDDNTKKVTATAGTGTEATTTTTSKSSSSSSSDHRASPSNKSKEKPTPDATNSSYMTGVKYSEDGLQVPVGNGGSTKRYKWTQTIEECSVMIGVPDGTKGKDLNVSITPTSISVKSKKPLLQPSGDTPTPTTTSTPHTFVEGKLVAKIRADESTWTLEGSVLVVTLEKLKKTFWDTIIEGDEKIDTDLVDSKRHISEYDDVTQGQIRKIIFDQNQERRGLETSDDILGNNKKNKQTNIPTMPPGVEYINQQKVDDNVPATTKTKVKGG